MLNVLFNFDFYISSQVHFFDDYSNLWNKMTESISKNFLITASTISDNRGLPPETENQLGLPSDHAFCVMELHEIKNKNQDIRLLKLRNPWSSQNWKGPWCDSDARWTSVKKLQVYFGLKQPGEFYISLDDFCRYYNSVTISKWDLNLDHVCFPLNKNKASSITIVKSFSIPLCLVPTIGMEETLVIYIIFS